MAEAGICCTIRALGGIPFVGRADAPGFAVSRPIILTFVGCYLPGYKSGGPVRSIANMVEHLGDEFDFRIVTSDRDVADAEPYPNVGVDAWNRVGKAEVFYASPERRSLSSLARLMRETQHDVVYVNSFFSPVFTLRPLLARVLGLAPKKPMVIAPRGEFSRGAVTLKSWKKRPYVRLTGAFGLYRDLTWQASSEYEAEDIRREMGRTAKRIVTAVDLPTSVDSDELPKGRPAADGPLRVVFLSRIARKKNLDFALRALAGVTAPVEMSVYGVVEDEAYWNQCKSIIDTLTPHLAVRYGGSIPHDSVVKTLSEHDLFFFPTRGENYGHVIHEALLAGLPVLLSDQTPWRCLLESGVGWDLPLGAPEEFAAVIDAYACLSAEERAAQRARARAFAVRVATDSEAVARNVALFRDCVCDSTQPSGTS